MSLTFSNHYTADVSIAILWYSPGCPDGGDWEKAGWYNVAVGQSMTVFNGSLHSINRYWYFHGEAADGTTWTALSGQPNVVTAIPNTAFDWCWNTGSTGAFEASFREIDVGSNDGYTVNLTP